MIVLPTRQWPPSGRERGWRCGRFAGVAGSAGEWLGGPLLGWVGLDNNGLGGLEFGAESVLAGRPGRAWSDVVGYFVNPVALRADLAGEPAVGELLERVRVDGVAVVLGRNDVGAGGGEEGLALTDQEGTGRNSEEIADAEQALRQAVRSTLPGG